MELAPSSIGQPETTNITDEAPENDDPEHGDAQWSDDPDPLLYLISSSSGYGHLSRAVAIAHELDQATPVTLMSHTAGHQFLLDNLAHSSLNFRLEPLYYGFNISDEAFLEANSVLRDELTKRPVVVNDFFTQIPAIRSIPGYDQSDQLVVGVYHSMDGYHTDDLEIKAYQERYKKIARTHDVVFLTEPRTHHKQPYELDESTIVIPCDPVVRKADKDPELVKRELGLSPEDEFIYVQGGMTGSKELRNLVISMGSVSLSGLKIVMTPCTSVSSQLVIDNGNIISVSHRMDAQNIVAASAGVISKPGMGILCEAIDNKKPLLLVDDAGPERKLKYAMLHELLGDDLPYRIYEDRPITRQIEAWQDNAEEISQRFSQVPCEGARKISQMLRRMRGQPQGFRSVEAS